MAYLNVRERRLETTIAYVGAGLSGTNTDLQPVHRPRFNDCDVMVKVVQTGGELSRDRLDQLLADVDGVVVVVDAAPTASDENRRTMELVRASAAARPVVVQLNGADVVGAASAADLAAIVEDWPVVEAAAARGEGVVATLEMALESVIESMRAKSASAPTFAAAANPLLSALRQILRETVAEHMESVERSVSEHVAAAARAAVQEALAPVRASLESSVAALQEDVLAVRSTMAASAKESARALSSLVTTTTATTTQLEALEANVLGLAMRGDVEASEARVREEIVTRGRGEREHVTSTAAVLRRAIDGVATDVKKSDRNAELVAALERIQARADTLGEALVPVATTTSTLSALPGRVAALENAILRELREALAPRLGRVGDAVQNMNATSADAFDRSEKRITEIHAGLTELLDELKKRKKGFFS